MDRHALVPAAIVAAFGAVCFWLLPGINGAITVADPIRAGDVIQLGTAATFAPASGWDLVSGSRQAAGDGTQYPKTAAVSRNGVQFSVITDTFAGTPGQLVDQIRSTNARLGGDSALTVDGRESTFTTVGGQHGVISRFTAGSGAGVVAAFVFDGTGVEVAAYGPTQIDSSTEHDIISMIESIQPITGRAGSGS